MKVLLSLILLTLMAGVGVIAYGGQQLIDEQDQQADALELIACLQRAEAENSIWTRTYTRDTGPLDFGDGAAGKINSILVGTDDRDAAVAECG